MTIRRIKSIHIQNIKGIEQRDFVLDIIPNKPSLLVAPNGFGKSSVATAFRSLNNKRLDLHKDNHHKNDESLTPSLKVILDNEDKTSNEYEATNSKNDISNVFDIHVINSQLTPRCKKLKIQGQTIVSSSIDVSPIILINKIPNTVKFTYSHTQSKRDFGPNGKVLPRIEDVLNNKQLMCRMFSEVDFSKATQVKPQNAINKFKTAVNSLSGTTDVVLSSISTADVTEVAAFQPIKDIIRILREFDAPYSRGAEFVLAAMQLIDIYNEDKSNFKKVIEYYNYQLEKEAYLELFSMLKSTWKKIAPKEDKDNGLIIEFPKANQISNGERDILCFVAMLMQSRIKLKKAQCILIIDEVFDYLDDANLVAAQYYITQMITEFKKEGRMIFPLIMTHLNPYYFKNFCFKKLHVYYLDKSTSTGSKLVEKIILKREEATIKEIVSKHFLHYHPSDKNMDKEFSDVGLATDLASSKKFYDHALKELQGYLDNKKYDAISVCFAVRLIIERWVYNSLDDALKDGFINTNKTRNKLDYASDNGVDVPEVFYMLGLIYNEVAHIKNEPGNNSPIISKLGNLTIRHMISQCKEICNP